MLLSAWYTRKKLNYHNVFSSSLYIGIKKRRNTEHSHTQRERERDGWGKKWGCGENDDHDSSSEVHKALHQWRVRWFYIRFVYLLNYYLLFLIIQSIPSLVQHPNLLIIYVAHGLDTAIAFTNHIVIRYGVELL